MNKLFCTLLTLLIFISACNNYVQKVRDGQTAFERKQFAVAADMLTKDYKKSKSRIEKGKIAFMIGESYRRMNKIDKASSWYLTAYNGGYGVDALKEYSYTLKRSQQYEEARQSFKNLGIEIGSPYEYRREITACNLAIDWLERSKDSGYQVKSEGFNSANSDYAPTLYKEGQLLFTSDRGSSTGDEVYNWTGGNFSDIFVVDADGSGVRNFDNAINTANNEGTITFSQDYSELIFTRCYSDEKNGDNYCQLMSSRIEGSSWTEPTPMEFTKEEVNYGHPSLSKDGSTLYFAAEDPDGWGGFDIYSTDRGPDGWEEPQILGRAVNTIGDEKFPFIDEDTLYFASNHHPGMGGLDIFRTYKMDNDNWAPVHNLKAPINSGSDDFGYVIDYKAQKEEDVLQFGYFSSSRLEGKGNDDIYSFERRLPPPPPVVDTVVEKPPVVVYKMILEGYVLEKIYKIPGNPNSKVLGRKPLPGSEVKVQVNGKEKVFTIGEDGLFTLELDENTDYEFLASKSEYLNNQERFSTKGIGKDPNNPTLRFEIEIVLDKIFKDQEITLENIYYDFERWNIRDDAKPTLNELATILNRNPGISIQLASHTDCRGGARYNQDLSQKRAQSAVDYLISQGITPERLTAKGYGKEAPAVDCVCARCSEEEHQSNRRTTFKILE
ncbi:MAG: OmpA family protein [Bacteroidota bacterium]